MADLTWPLLNPGQNTRSLFKQEEYANKKYSNKINTLPQRQNQKSSDSSLRHYAVNKPSICWAFLRSLSGMLSVESQRLSSIEDLQISIRYLELLNGHTSMSDEAGKVHAARTGNNAGPHQYQW